MKIISNSFYAVGDSKSPLIVILIQQTINVTLNWILAKEIGLDGIGIATSVSTAVGSFLIIFVYFKKFGKVKDGRNMKTIGKITLAALFMVLVANFCYEFLSDSLSLIFSLLATILLAGLCYLFIIMIMKIDEIEVIKGKALNKLRRK